MTPSNGEPQSESGRMKLHYLALRSLFCCLFLLAGYCFPPGLTYVAQSKKTAADRIARAEAEECYIAALDMDHRGRDREALQLYKKAYDLDPASRLLRDIVAGKYVETRRFKQALAVLRRVRKNTPDLSSDEKRLVADIYFKLGDTASTVKEIESIADKAIPDYYNLGAVYESQGKTEKALRCFFEVYNRGDSPIGMGLKIIQMQMALRQYGAADSLVSVMQSRYGEKPEFCNLHGLIALSKRDTARALVYFNKASAVDSSFEDGARNAAQLYLQKNDYPAAAAAYEYLCRISVQHHDAYARALAIVYYYGKQYDKAVPLLVSILGKYIDDPEIHFFLGCAYAELGKRDEAHFEFEKTLALKEDYFEAWEHLYFLAVHEKDLDAALSVARRFAGRFSDYAGAWRLVGSILSLRKEFGAAQTALSKAVALDSADASAWFDLGSCFERNNDIPHAAAAFRKVLQLQPADPAASNYLGYMWADRGMKLDSAKILLESALAREPDNGAYLDSYGWILFRMGDNAKAFEYIGKALTRIHNDPEVFEHLGDILDQRNDVEGALQAYEKCLEYNPDDQNRIRRKILRLEAIIRGKDAR
jgi:tetratricopeptide (TPR) repeat protein